MYAHVLGRLASTQLFKSSRARCAFGTEIDPQFNLRFELFSIGQNVHDECSLSRCASLPSDLLGSVDIDRRAFSDAVDAVVNAARRYDSADLKSPSVSAKRAATEAYRYIYQPGTKERIYVDLSPDDFLTIGFDEFVSWFRGQQSALRELQSVQESSRRVPAPDVSSHTKTEDVSCASAPDVSIEDLNIDHHGWGHQSIIMIKNGWRHEGILGIDNTALRAICHRDQKDLDSLNAARWSEVVGRVSCAREQMSDRDRWLIVFSNQETAKTGAEMRRYAIESAQAFKTDRCVDPGLRIVVVHFLKPR